MTFGSDISKYVSNKPIVLPYTKLTRIRNESYVSTLLPVYTSTKIFVYA